MTPWQQKHLGLVPYHPGISRMADAARDFCRDFVSGQPGRLLALCGASGCGKTHTAKRVYHWARSCGQRTGASIVFHRWPEACDLIMDGFDGLVDDCMAADLCVLDDIGAESDRYKTGKPIDKLCQILSRRERKFTVLTTNIGPAAWGTRFDIRIADRLLRNSTVIDLSDIPSFSVWRLTHAK